MANYRSCNLKIVPIQLTTFSNKEVRGLGKYLPVTSLFIKKKYGKARRVPKYHNGCPTLFFQTGTLVLSLRTENDLPVVKYHGRPDFVDPSRVRSRRRHRSFRTKPISAKTFLLRNKEGIVMAISDIGLLNMRYSFSNHIRKCSYKNDHGIKIKKLNSKNYFKMYS